MMVISHHDSKSHGMGRLRIRDTRARRRMRSRFLHPKPDTAQPAFHPHSKVSTDLQKPCTEPQPKRNHTTPNQNPNLSKIGARIETCDGGKKPDESPETHVERRPTCIAFNQNRNQAKVESSHPANSQADKERLLGWEAEPTE